jgi:hypothetical protein
MRNVRKQFVMQLALKDLNTNEMVDLAGLGERKHLIRLRRALDKVILGCFKNSKDQIGKMD